MSQQQQEHALTVETDGTIRAIYADEIEPVLSLGLVSIDRVSHVEPANGGGWTADMSPVGGPVLGPFGLRCEALAAEVAWLKRELGL